MKLSHMGLTRIHDPINPGRVWVSYKKQLLNRNKTQSSPPLSLSAAAKSEEHVEFAKGF